MCESPWCIAYHRAGYTRTMETPALTSTARQGPVGDAFVEQVLRYVGRAMRRFDALLVPLEPDDALD